MKDGFHHALSAIIDGHVTTILTGIVLYIFGSGPVQGFATTLVIGLLLSLFSSIFIARLCFEFMLDRNMNITVGNRITLNAFQNTHIDFIGLRKKNVHPVPVRHCSRDLQHFHPGFGSGTGFYRRKKLYRTVRSERSNQWDQGIVAQGDG